MPVTNVGRRRGECSAADKSPEDRRRARGTLRRTLERILGEGLFGSIWPREALTPAQREMITLSSLIVLNREVQLRRHLGNALNIGLTPEQIVELIIHDTWYAGAPGGIQALTICKSVFEERGIDFTPARIHDSNEDPDSLFQRGDEYRRNYMGSGPARPAPPTKAEAELGRITGEYYWGATWTRPGLDLPSRCLVHDDVPGCAWARRAAAEPHPWGAEHRVHAGPDHRGVRAHDAVRRDSVRAWGDGHRERDFCERVIHKVRCAENEWGGFQTRPYAFRAMRGRGGWRKVAGGYAVWQPPGPMIIRPYGGGRWPVRGSGDVADFGAAGEPVAAVVEEEFFAVGRAAHPR